MKIEITEGGIYTSSGEELAIGTQLTVRAEPTDWVGRYRVIADNPAKPVAVTNPAQGALPDRASRLKELSESLTDEDFIASGAPDVHKINDLLGEGEKPFTAAERDKLWAKG